MREGIQGSDCPYGTQRLKGELTLVPQPPQAATKFETHASLTRSKGQALTTEREFVETDSRRIVWMR